MMMRSIATLLSVGMLVSVTACAEQQQEAEPEMDQAAVLPDASGAALWTYLTEVDYQSWPLWPEKGRFYQGGEPHGMLLTTYINEAAEQAVRNMAGSMPPGAIIVKENYMPDSTLAAVTVMYKVAGYNPEHNDWFWLKRLADGTVELEGQVAGCQNCHGANRANDYVLTSSIQQQ